MTEQTSAGRRWRIEVASDDEAPLDAIADTVGYVFYCKNITQNKNKPFNKNRVDNR